MTPLVTVERASLQNLTDTYMALGRASGKGEEIVGSGIHGYASSFPHPISNFAIANDVTPNIAADLKRIAETRSAFHVYLYSEVAGRLAKTHLRKQGFRNTHVLQVMSTAPIVPPGGLPIDRAESDERRDGVSQFMLSQFPSTYPDWIRDEVRHATAAAEGLDLYSMAENGEIVAAMMLRRNDSCIGLYNLCVKAEERGRGLGRLLVTMAKRYASNLRVPLILQCDRSLVSWYQALGFVKTGKIEVYLLPRVL
jgi:predicted GNAT family acetyltransferase